MNLDPAKLLIVAVVALIVLGPEKLPGVLRQAGRYWSVFKSIRDTVQGEMSQVLTQVTSVGTSVSETLVDPLSQMKGRYSAMKTQVSESFLPSGLVSENVNGDDNTDSANTVIAKNTDARQCESATYKGPNVGGDYGWPVFRDAGVGAFAPGSPELN